MAKCALCQNWKDENPIFREYEDFCSEDHFERFSRGLRYAQFLESMDRQAEPPEEPKQ
jgi:hypothetical protein